MATPFQIHLTFYSTTPTPASASTLPSPGPRITLLSGLRRSLALGLNFPAAVLNTLAIRLLYGSPYNLFLLPVAVRAVRARRTMLEDVPVPPADGGLRGLVHALLVARKGAADIVHVCTLWLFGAAVPRRAAHYDGTALDWPALDACRKGTFFWDVERRRRYRDAGDVLPFWRGGPIWCVYLSSFIVCGRGLTGVQGRGARVGGAKDIRRGCVPARDAEDRLRRAVLFPAQQVVYIIVRIALSLLRLVGCAR
jgi:hypothetical protein